MPVEHFGCDADKAFLTVACHERPGHIQRIGNDVGPIDEWLGGLAPDSVLAVEATGTCHQVLLERAFRHSLTIYLLNPRDVRHYAESLRRRAKTDRVDAQVIARYVAREKDNLRPYVPPSAAPATWPAKRTTCGLTCRPRPPRRACRSCSGAAPRSCKISPV
ncbi:IS110 family transposase [Luteibacter yeojuensis]